MTKPIKPDDGGSAFPYGVNDYDMSLREYFAAHAPDVPYWFAAEEVRNMERIIAWRWAYADAMIAARETAAVPETRDGTAG